MAGKNSAARQPVLNDMSDDDNAAFEAMRTGNAVTPPPAPGPETAPETPPAEPAKPAAAKPETPAPPEKPPAAAPEQPEGADRENRMVPHGALHEERERRKAAEQREKDKDAQVATLTDRLARLAEAIGPKLEAPTPPQAPAVPEIPDPDKDPVAYIRATFPLVKQIMEERAQGQQRQVQMTAQQRAVSEAVNDAVNSEATFRTSNSDYDQAAAHLQAARNAELEALGVPPAQRAQMVQNETMQLAVMARQSRRNFAQTVYNLAKARGYQAPAATPAAPPVAPPPVAPATAVPSEEQRLEMARRGQEQARSLSNAGGAAPKPALTAEKLATMSDAEFAAVLAKLSPAQQRQIFGR